MGHEIPPENPTSPNSADRGQIRVVLIEDDANLRESLVGAIKRCPALTWLADFGSAEEALENIAQLSPDVAVVDLNLPGMSGIACTRAMKQVLPDCEALVLTTFDDTERVLAAIKAGARGYLVKGASSKELLQAIQDVADGGAPMTPAIARKVLESFKSPTLSAEPSGPEIHESLTEREKEILQLLAQGKVIKEIPDIIHVSQSTVRFHLRSIYKKLHVNNLTQAVVRYLES